MVGGGDTGDAVKLRDGWADIEVVARIKESYFKIAKKKQMTVAIKILQLLGLTTIDFKTIDVDVKFTRNKTDNLQSKAQAYATLIGTKTLVPADALEMCDLTTNVLEVTEKGETYWQDKIQQQLELEAKYSQKVKVVNDPNEKRDKTNNTL